MQLLARLSYRSNSATLLVLLLSVSSALATHDATEPRAHAREANAPRTNASPNATCSPGGNFDLSKFILQLPVGETASSSTPRQVSSQELAGCQGFSDEFFSTDPTDGSLVMKVQGSPKTSQCVHTPDSTHCRSELREATPSSWSPFASLNRLYGDVKVTQNTGEVVVGQIHIDDAISVKPVCELYYNADGALSLGVQKSRNGTQQRSATPLGTVAPGQRFTYEIRYENNTLSVSINGKAAETFPTFDLDGPDSYFKAGSYNQGDGPTTVQFYNITTSHANTNSSGSPAAKSDSAPKASVSLVAAVSMCLFVLLTLGS